MSQTPQYLLFLGSYLCYDMSLMIIDKEGGYDCYVFGSIGLFVHYTFVCLSVSNITQKLGIDCKVIRGVV